MADKQLSLKGHLFVLLWLVNLTKHFVASQNPEAIEYTIYDDLQPTALIGNIVDKTDLRERYSYEEFRELSFVFLNEGIHEDYFSLDELSGDIHAIQSVDRDKICPQLVQCSLRMDVAVQPAKYFEVLKVVIHILDLNDNTPEFEPHYQSYDISEAASPGIVGSVRLAKDVDSPKFGIVEYRMRSDVDAFKIDVRNSSGEFEVHLVLNKSLDRETVEYYQLLVVAKDGGSQRRTGTLTLNIHVLDVNDNNPKFESSTYDVNIPENLTPGASIITVEATDEDTGANGEILYSFSQQTVQDIEGIFAIERTSGMIYLQKELDYESRNSYSLIVVAQDQGDNSIPANTRVLINVNDVNDHVPRISLNTLEEDRVVQLEESSPIESFIAHVSVYDEDDGENGHVECFLTGDAGKFQIIELYKKEFKIITTSKLDREEQSLYNLHISCQDYGTPQLSSAETITVELLDENDNAPQFSPENYHAAVREHSSVGRLLLKVSASDPDAGDNGEVIYSLDESAGDMFSIHSETGEINVVAEFDREVMTQKIFFVVATDEGDEPKSSSAMVTVEILDIDDQVPVFNKKMYYMNVTENSSRDTFVGRVEATDTDSTRHAQFSYYVDGTRGSVDSYFRIDPEQGKLYAKRPLDREEEDLYIVPVIVQSYNSPNQIDTTEVQVRVLDRNDNPPVFTFPSTTDNRTVISNKLLNGYYVTKIKAYDLDIGQNAELTYEIVDGSAAHYFTVDPVSGEVFVNGDLSRLHNTKLILQILVKDNGELPQMTIGTLMVVVNSTFPVMDDYNSEDSVDYSVSGNADLSFTDIVAIIVGAASGTIILILFLVFLWLFFSKRRKPQKDARAMPWYSTQPSKSPSNDDLVPDEKNPNEKVNKGVVKEDSGYCRSPSNQLTPEKDKDCVIQTGNVIREKSPTPAPPPLPVYTPSVEKVHTDQFPIPQILLSSGSDEKDNDSGCADLSQGSNEEHLPVSVNPPSVQAKCYHHQQQPNHNPHYSSLQREYRNKPRDTSAHRPYIEPLPTTGHYAYAPKSFAEWLNSENQHLKSQGHKYQVSKHKHHTSPRQHHILRNGSAKKTVRFTEPEKSSALMKSANNITNYQLNPDLNSELDLEHLTQVKPSVSDSHLSNNSFEDATNSTRNYGSLDRRRYLHANGHAGGHTSPQLCAKHHGKYHIGHSNDGSLV